MHLLQRRALPRQHLGDHPATGHCGLELPGDDRADREPILVGLALGARPADDRDAEFIVRRGREPGRQGGEPVRPGQPGRAGGLEDHNSEQDGRAEQQESGRGRPLQPAATGLDHQGDRDGPADEGRQERGPVEYDDRPEERVRKHCLGGRGKGREQVGQDRRRRAQRQHDRHDSDRPGDTTGIEPQSRFSHVHPLPAPRRPVRIPRVSGYTTPPVSPARRARPGYSARSGCGESPASGRPRNGRQRPGSLAAPLPQEGGR